MNSSDIFNGATSYTYDDLILHPGFIDFSMDQVQLRSRFTKNIWLNLPFASSPMDTVTEAKMAIQMALHGGIGIIHYNNTIEEQVKEVMKVKRYSNGFISHPIVFGPHNTISDVINAKRIYGFSGFPITETGEMEAKLIGLVSNRDIDFVENVTTLLKNVMTSISDLTTASKGCTLTEAFDILKHKKISRLPIIDKEDNLVSLVCRKDIKNASNYPLASINLGSKQLIVGAAVSTHTCDKERIDALLTAGVDVIIVDAAQGNSCYQLDTIRYIKARSELVQVVAGNIVTSAQARSLLSAKPDALRVGMGIGSICTTQEVCGVGRGQCSAIYDVVNCKEVIEANIPIIADGGISNTSHIIKAYALGASSVMMGSMFAGTTEAPGEYIYENGTRWKTYRGMGSAEVLKSNVNTAERYLAGTSNVKVAQGVSGMVAGKGSLKERLPYMEKSVKHGFQDLGYKSMDALYQNRNCLPMELRSMASYKEGNVHNLKIN